MLRIKKASVPSTTESHATSMQQQQRFRSVSCSHNLHSISKGEGIRFSLDCYSDFLSNATTRRERSLTADHGTAKHHQLQQEPSSPAAAAAARLTPALPDHGSGTYQDTIQDTGKQPALDHVCIDPAFALATINTSMIIVDPQEPSTSSSKSPSSPSPDLDSFNSSMISPPPTAPSSPLHLLTDLPATAVVTVANADVDMDDGTVVPADNNKQQKATPPLLPESVHMVTTPSNASGLLHPDSALQLMLHEPANLAPDQQHQQSWPSSVPICPTVPNDSMTGRFTPGHHRRLSLTVRIHSVSSDILAARLGVPGGAADSQHERLTIVQIDNATATTTAATPHSKPLESSSKSNSSSSSAVSQTSNNKRKVRETSPSHLVPQSQRQVKRRKSTASISLSVSTKTKPEKPGPASALPSLSKPRKPSLSPEPSATNTTTPAKKPSSSLRRTSVHSATEEWKSSSPPPYRSATPINPEVVEPVPETPSSSTTTTTHRHRRSPTPAVVPSKTPTNSPLVRDTTSPPTTILNDPDMIDTHTAGIIRPLTQIQPAGTGPGACQFCHSTKTGQWRRGPAGQRTLCNACGINWVKKVKIEARKNGGSLADAEKRLAKEFEKIQKVLDHVKPPVAAVNDASETGLVPGISTWNAIMTAVATASNGGASGSSSAVGSSRSSKSPEYTTRPRRDSSASTVSSKSAKTRALFSTLFDSSDEEDGVDDVAEEDDDGAKMKVEDKMQEE